MKTSKARKGNLKNVLQFTVVIFILIKKSFGLLIIIWEAFESFVQSFQMLPTLHLHMKFSSFAIAQLSADFESRSPGCLKSSEVRKCILS